MLTISGVPPVRSIADQALKSVPTRIIPSALISIKTAADTWPALEAEILRQHPYELPEIIAVPISTGHRPYLEWIAASST